MFSENEIADEKLAQAKSFEAMCFRKAVQQRVFHDNLIKKLPMAQVMAIIAVEEAKEKSFVLRMCALSLHSSDALEVALKYKEEGNFYMEHKRYFMAIFMYTQGNQFAPSESDIEATIFNNISAALYFLKLYNDSLFNALDAVKINPLYGKARRRAAECALLTGKFRLCREMCEKLLEQNQYSVEAGSMLAQTQTRADEAREALDNNPELKRLIEVLHERGVKFSESLGSEEIYEHMLEPMFFPLRSSRVHLAADGVTLVWPVAFHFVDVGVMHFGSKVVEKTTMKNLLQKIMSERAIARATKLNPQKCYVYYPIRQNKTLRKVNLKKSIKDIVDEEEFEVYGGCLAFIVSKKMLDNIHSNSLLH